MQELAKLIRTSRIKKGFKTTKDFWAHIQQLHVKSKKTWISYAYYQQIETARRLPPIKLLLELATYLDIDIRLSCMHFARAHMPTEETRAFFEVSAENSSTPELANLATVADKWDTSAVHLGDKILEFFASNLLSYDVFCVITNTTQHTVTEISKFLSIAEDQTHAALHELQEIGLIRINNNAATLTNVAFRFYGNPQNQTLLWKLFARHSEALHHHVFIPAHKNKFIRASALIPLMPSAAARLSKNLHTILTEFYSLDEAPTNETTPYYIGLIFGPRFLSNNSK